MDLDVVIYRNSWMPTCVRRLTATVNKTNDFKDFIRSVVCQHRNFTEVHTTNHDVEGVSIHNRPTFIKIPTNLNNFFPQMVALDIKNCGLKNISRNDLKGLENLKEICIIEMEIEELPGDLFADLINLESIELQENKIKKIGKNIFKHLNQLKFVDLQENVTIDLIYASLDFSDVKVPSHTTKIVKFKELNAILDGIYWENYENSLENRQNTVNFQKIPGNNSKHSLSPNINSEVLQDLGKILKFNEFKDFTIKIGENNFKVHKLMLAARSPTLAEMIKNNPDADELILEDIEVEVFKIILDYIYEDKMPENNEVKLEEIFSAAGKLKLEKLINYSGLILCDKIDRNNSIEFLRLSIKYDHKKLKEVAIEEIRKIFADSSYSFEEEIYENFELLKVIVEEKLKADEKIKKTVEEFKKLKSV